MLLTFVYDRKNENHWSLLINYSLLITHYSEYKHPNKLKKISMNSTMKTKKENNLENFSRQR